MNSTKVQNPRRNSYADRTHSTAATHIHTLYTAHARKSLRTREIKSVVYGRNAENEPVSRIKMADYRALVSAIAIFETKPLYEKRQINSGASTILSP